MQNLDFSPRLRGRRAGVAEARPDDSVSAVPPWSRWRLAGLFAVGVAAAAFIGGLSLGIKIGRYGQEEDRIVRNASTAGGMVAPGRSSAALERPALPEQPPGSGPSGPRSTGTVAPSGPSGRESLSNSGRSEERAGDNPGRYVILLGTYSPEGADRLYRKLRAIPRLRRLQYHSCRAMSEAGGRGGIFQLTHPQNRSLRRVYVGCHRNLHEANEALALLKAEGLLDSTNAQLIDIE